MASATKFKEFVEQKLESGSELSCCVRMERLLSSISKGGRIEHGTATTARGDGPNQRLGVFHTLCLVGSNGLPEFIFATVRNFQDIPCQRCSLMLYIHTRQYADIYSLHLDRDPYYFQLTALMDMVGPLANYQISKAFRKSKSAFLGMYRFNAHRLMECIKSHSRQELMPYYLQRLKAAEGLSNLLFHCNKSRHKKWLIHNPEDIRLTESLCAAFLDDSYYQLDSSANACYEIAVHILVWRLGKYMDRKVVRRYLSFFKKKEMAKSMRIDMKRELRESHWKAKAILIHCANTECKVEYYRHKYDIDKKKYALMKRKGKTRCAVRKWYTCKGCHGVFYCSKKCQKVAWNSVAENHGDICRKVTLSV